MATAGVTEMGRVTVEVPLANYWDVMRAQDRQISSDDVRRTRLSGIVDTGAARLILPSLAAQKLGLEHVGETGVRYADQRTARRAVVHNIWLELCGRGSVFSAILDPDRQDARHRRDRARRTRPHRRLHAKRAQASRCRPDYY
ncbi:MAG TPA: hypothetical protein VFW73_00660 [Lacipirellulaceae bacterium]|nr:hypothetical protein [Lacipirellulaceae bacterium]